MHCSTPFTTLHVHPNGFIPCCPGWFTNAEDFRVDGGFENPWDAWNHPKFVKLRQMWLDSDSSGCKHCIMLLAGSKFMDEPRYWMKPVMERGPMDIIFANDLSCNLHCWSCRSRPIIEKQQDRVFRQTYSILDTFHESIEYISAIGSGDPFASPAWLKILQTMDMEKHKKLKIELFTNGLLVPRYWDSISHMHDNIIRIKMSIDAVSKDIYEKTRLGGKHKDLNKALEFISKLGKEFVLNMVVQSENFTDVPLVCEKAIELGCNKLNLTMIRYWHQMRGGRAKFDEVNLARKDHPKRVDFLNMIKNNEELLKHPIINEDMILPDGHKIIKF